VAERVHGRHGRRPVADAPRHKLVQARVP
jgi:hypothetical protein